MSFVAVAVVGGAVISGVVADRAGSRAERASAAGSAQAADATLESTRMQLEEIGRQFDYQQTLLRPLVQNQTRAAQAYGNLLGYNRENIGPTPTPYDARPGEAQRAFEEGGGGGRTGQVIQQGPGGFRDPNLDPTTLGASDPSGSDAYRNVLQNRLAGPTAGADELVNYVDRTGLARGGSAADEGVQRAAGVRIGDAITGNESRDRAAGVLNAGDYGTDLAVRNAQENLLGARFTGTESGDRANNVRLAAPGGYENDPRFKFARDTAIVGDTFTESPGYAYTLEQSQREVDRKNSAGGNYGGRALMEAQRRSQGLAAGEYYNWVGARGADLARQDTALGVYQGREATDVARGDQALEQDLTRRLATGQFDISRMDAATADYLQRRGIDISRGDAAVSEDLARVLATRQADIGRGDAALGDYRRRQELDLARGDAAYENYIGRRSGDVQRTDAAVSENTRLRQYDVQRRDQGYYNYLNSLGSAAGLGTGVAQAVGSSAAAGQAAQGAYAQQGGQLSAIYGQRGQDAANIGLGTAANVNNSIQSGIENYLTYRGYRPPANQPRP